MCYLLLALGQAAGYPFILAANRDEFYARESAPADFWPDQPYILAGRDLEQGGTWMGISTEGKFAALTNFRQSGSHDPSARSRGLLIPDFLAPGVGTHEFSQQLERGAQTYNGFNLIYGNLPDQLYYYSNRTELPPCLLEPGVYALSNHLLDTAWPKVVRGKIKINKILSSKPSVYETELFELLADQNIAPENELPDTGIDKQLEHLLSPIFIHSEQYGTRCSSVITVDKQKRLNFSELTYDNGADAVFPEQKFSLILESDARPK